MSMWACLNYTIGESIPLIGAAYGLPKPTVLLVVSVLFSFLRTIFDL